MSGETNTPLFKNQNARSCVIPDLFGIGVGFSIRYTGFLDFKTDPDTDTDPEEFRASLLNPSTARRNG